MDSTDLPSVRLSPQERFILCNEIGRFGLILGREAESGSGETIAAALDARSDSSPWERIRLLADQWPRLEATLYAIAACPDSATLTLPRSLPIHAARGNPTTVAGLARDPNDHRAWIQRSTLEPESAAPARIREQRAAHTVHTGPNRVAADFLRALAQETQALHRLALFCDEPTAAATAEEMHRRVRRRLHTAPFSEFSSTSERGRGDMAEILLRCSPAYRSLYTVIRAVRSGLSIDWSESAVLRFPVLEAWHLFEIWCFLRVGIALHNLGWQPIETDCLQIVQAGMRLRLAHGKASRIRFRASGSRPTTADARQDQELELIYQPQFLSANRNFAGAQAGFRSLSHVMQPDIALVRKGRMLLLDPKYRAYSEAGAEQEDVDKMHAYRDAIVRTDLSTGKPVSAVDAAWCLFPGAPASASFRPERLRAYPASTQRQPFGTAGVGAVQARPGAENAELAALIRHWLETAE